MMTRERDAAEVLRLFDAVRELLEQSIAALERQFQRLREGWAELRRRRIEEERVGAPRHNIFRLLGLQRSEVNLHSPLLRDLLDPYGSHGQGTLFL
ncbi:MAG: PD-(D/E)XK nuclease family protein, partial [Bradyrhizobium sp.]|nr:PD-(D/E)XK nuclease family protein [Bradyrhizobium sp.]